MLDITDDVKLENAMLAVGDRYKGKVVLAVATKKSLTLKIGRAHV